MIREKTYVCCACGRVDVHTVTSSIVQKYEQCTQCGGQSCLVPISKPTKSWVREQYYTYQGSTKTGRKYPKR